MAERNFYDLLEVSNTASSETIQAAYERLAVNFDPAQESNAGNAAARIQYNAIRQAYLVLNNAESRAQYDRKQQLRTFTPTATVEAGPFWTLPKLLVVGVILLGMAGFYFKHQKEQARLEAEKMIAVAKAREAEEKAKAEVEVERMAILRENQRERAERMEASRLRRERDADVRQFQRDARVNEINNRVYSSLDRSQTQREDYKRRADEDRVKREEAQAAMAARQQLSRDRVELCRIERERYGKSISC